MSVVSEFSKVKNSKRLPTEAFMTEWQAFYLNYEVAPQNQKMAVPLQEDLDGEKGKRIEKKSFRKMKRSKTVDMAAFLSSIEEVYEHFAEDHASTKNDPIPLHMRVKFPDDLSKGENSLDFSSLDTTITPLRELRIDEPSSFTPFIIKESPKGFIGKEVPQQKTALIKDLKNTQRRTEKEEKMNKETRKNSMKKGLKKPTASSRILKFD